MQLVLVSDSSIFRAPVAQRQRQRHERPSSASSTLARSTQGLSGGIGRRTAFRAQRPRGREGSNPSSGTEPARRDGSRAGLKSGSIVDAVQRAVARSTATRVIVPGGG